MKNLSPLSYGDFAFILLVSCFLGLLFSYVKLNQEVKTEFLLETLKFFKGMLSLLCLLIVVFFLNGIFMNNTNFFLYLSLPLGSTFVLIVMFYVLHLGLNYRKILKKINE